MTDTISVSQSVGAPAQQVWEMLSDLPRMGEWSPENRGGTWVKGATGPAVGARFKGANANDKKNWKTDAKVTTCVPGTAFAFDVSVAAFAVATWSYTIEATPSGCVVTETWTDKRGKLVKALGGPVSGVADREVHNRSGMETTLANLAAAAEATTT